MRMLLTATDEMVKLYRSQRVFSVADTAGNSNEKLVTLGK